MLVESSRLVSVKKLKVEFSQTLEKVLSDNESVYIINDDDMRAVMMPFQQYEYLSMLDEMFEHCEIAEMIKDRMVNYDVNKTVSWESVKDNL